MRILMLLAPLLLAACTSLSHPTFVTEEGAIRGYDAVSYFTENQAVKGDPKFSARHNGADWYFSSAENLRRFESDPGAYTPQYGGYCAYGMARNYVVSTDPQAFSIHDDKLYLNYSLSVRKTWSKDIPGNIVSADGNWNKKLASGDPVTE